MSPTNHIFPKLDQDDVYQGGARLSRRNHFRGPPILRVFMNCVMNSSWIEWVVVEVNKLNQLMASSPSLFENLLNLTQWRNWKLCFVSQGGNAPSPSLSFVPDVIKILTPKILLLTVILELFFGVPVSVYIRNPRFVRWHVYSLDTAILFGVPY